MVLNFFSKVIQRGSSEGTFPGGDPCEPARNRANIAPVFPTLTAECFSKKAELILWRTFFLPLAEWANIDIKRHCENIQQHAP